LTIPHRF